MDERHLAPSELMARCTRRVARSPRRPSPQGGIVFINRIPLTRLPRVDSLAREERQGLVSSLGQQPAAATAAMAATGGAGSGGMIP